MTIDNPSKTGRRDNAIKKASEAEVEAYKLATYLTDTFKNSTNQDLIFAIEQAGTAHRLLRLVTSTLRKVP